MENNENTISIVDFGISYKDRLDMWKTAINRLLEDLSKDLRVTALEKYTVTEEEASKYPDYYERDRIRMVLEKI